MSTSTYYGDTHIFTSRGRSDTITIKAGVGETLNIEGAGGLVGGVENSVQYNENGILAGDSNLLYDPDTEVLSSKHVYGIANNDAIGLSQLTLERPYVNFEASANTTDQGVSVSISENGTDSYLCLGAPKDIIDIFDQNGGCLLGYSANNDVNTWSDISGYLYNNNGITSATPGVFSDINEDGTLVYFGNLNSSLITMWSRTASAWSYIDYFNAGITMKISGPKTDCYSIIGKTANAISIYYNNVLQQGLKSAVGSGYITNLEIINGNTAFYEYEGFVYIWTRSGTLWSLIQTIDLSSIGTIISLSASANLLVLSTDTVTKVYSRPSSAISETYVLNDTLTNANTIKSTTNGICVFVVTTSTIIPYSLVAGSNWAPAVNTTPCLGCTQVACSTNYLVISRGTLYAGQSNASTIYKLDNNYTTGLVPINKLELGSVGDLGLELESLYSDASLTAKGSVSVLANEGSINTRALLGDVNFQSDSGDVNLTVLGAGVFRMYTTGTGNIEINSGGLADIGSTGAMSIVSSSTMAIQGTSASVSSTTGALTLSALSKMELNVNSIERLEVNTTEINTSLPIKVAPGSVSAPSYAFNVDTDTGLYYKGTDLIGFSNGGNSQTDVGSGASNTAYVGIGISAASSNTTSIGGSGLLASGNSYFDGTTTQGRVAAEFACTTPYNAGGITPVIVGFSGANGAVGSIYQNSSSSCALATSSDYRLKENIVPLDNATTTLRKLNPVSFNWKNCGTADTGFIAHEFAEVFPKSVIGSKDGKQMQNITKDVLFPYLVKSILELDTKVSTLQEQIRLMSKN